MLKHTTELRTPTPHRRRAGRGGRLPSVPTLPDVLRAMAAVYNEARRSGHADEGARLIYMLSQVRMMIEAVDTNAAVRELRARLDVLECRR